MADNIPDITQQSADSTPDNTPESSLQLADSPADDRQNSDIFSKISILELQEKYNIKRDSLYVRMRYLRITTYKVKGKAYLDSEQVAYMDGLHEHIQLTGKMEGYAVPEPSGPIEVETEDEQPTTTTSLAVAETQEIAATPNYSPKQKRSQSTQQTNDINAIVQSAQNKAAGTLIAENVIARHYIENPDLLPDELKTKIKESGEMPSVDPFAYADSLISLANIPGVA